MKKVILILLVIILAAGAGAGGYYYMTHRESREVTADMLTTKLQDAAELTTQKLIYQGVVDSTSGKIPILTKKTFVMTFTATVRAGFDVSKAEFDVTDDKVTVTIPPMELQEITIPPESLEFHTTSLTIIKPDGQEETKKALIEAEKDVKENAVKMGLLDAAGENAKLLLKGLLQDSVGDREIVVKIRDK